MVGSLVVVVMVKLFGICGAVVVLTASCAQSTFQVLTLPGERFTSRAAASLLVVSVLCCLPRPLCVVVDTVPNRIDG